MLNTNSTPLKYSTYWSLLLLVLTTFLSCHKDDDSPEVQVISPKAPEDVTTEEEEEEEEETIFGKWQIQEGFIETENSKYLLINDDYSIDILVEDEMGFKKIISKIKIAFDDDIVPLSRFSGGENYHYNLNENNLTITNDSDASVTTLQKDKNAPTTQTWVKTLSIVNQANAPWNRNVDIAFNDSMILFPNGKEEQNIALINTNTLTEEDHWITAMHPYAIAIEKSESTGTPLTFLGLDTEPKFNAYNTDDYTQIHNSMVLGTFDEFSAISIGGGPAIRGLASINNQTIWVANAHSKDLFLYNYTGTGEILAQESLNITPYGLAFQAGYLYVSDGALLHKCQTSPSFKAIESYKIPGYNIYGVTYDGDNFWLNTQKLAEESDEIILGVLESDNYIMKVNLSL